MSDLVKSITEQNFDDEVTKHQGLCLVDCWAEWCGPCRSLAPILDEVAAAMQNKVKIVKLNIDQCVYKATVLMIKSIPALLLFKDGQEVDRKVGFSSKEQLVEWLESHTA